MNKSNTRTAYELRFEPLHAECGLLAVPCDAAGRVDIDTLSERARLAYFFARTVIGRDYARPAVAPCTVH